MLLLLLLLRLVSLLLLLLLLFLFSFHLRLTLTRSGTITHLYLFSFSAMNNISRKDVFGIGQNNALAKTYGSPVVCNEKTKYSVGTIAAL